MRVIGFVLISLSLALGAGGMAQAAECACRSHEAKANANGSCSLTESVSYCTISFSAAAAKEQYQQQVELFAKTELISTFPNGKELQLKNLDDARKVLDSYPDARASVADLTTVALASTPVSEIDKSGGALIELFTAKGQVIESDFNEDGCVDFGIDTIRFLIIAANSEKRGNCSED